MTVAHTESMRNLLGVHAKALQSPTPQTAAVDSGRFVGSNSQLYQLVFWLWLGVFARWAVGSIVTKSTLGSHSEWQPRTVVWIVALSWWLLFDRGWTGLLGWRFLPASLVAAYGGLALMTSGLALAVWARL